MLRAGLDVSSDAWTTPAASRPGSDLAISQKLPAAPAATPARNASASAPRWLQEPRAEASCSSSAANNWNGILLSCW